jgi:hypothetical protein
MSVIALLISTLVRAIVILLVALCGSCLGSPAAC